MSTVQSVLPGGNPSLLWEQSTVSTGTRFKRPFTVETSIATRTATHVVTLYDPALPPPQSRWETDVAKGEGLIEIYRGGATREDRDGILRYQILEAPLVDDDGSPTGRTVPAIHVDAVKVDTALRRKGWASAMYAAVREAHPRHRIPAAWRLEPDGREVVRRLNTAYPEIHTGRFDNFGCIYESTDAADIYRLDEWRPHYPDDDTL